MYNHQYFEVWTLFIILLFGLSKCDIDGIEPGQCLSKFDYDYKVIQKLHSLEKEIEELKKQKTCSDRQPVAFMAELSANLVDPKISTTVVFDNVHTNVGNAYKPGPGVFISPQDGVYCITVVASSSTKSTSAALHLYIMHNKTKAGYIFLDGNNDRWLLRSATIVLEMKAEDTLHVIIGFIQGAATLGGCCFHTHISGFLVK